MRTIAWDVDDVLAPTMASWLERAWRPAHPSAPSFDQLSQNPPHELLGAPLDVYHSSLDAFRRDGYLDMQPHPAVIAFFRANGHRFRHVALTATPRDHAPTVACWVLRHFGDWIRTVGFVPSWRAGDERLPPYHADKGAWLSELKAPDILLDDRVQNLDAAKAVGVEGWLVGQPWNDGEPIEALLERLVTGQNS